MMYFVSYILFINQIKQESYSSSSEFIHSSLDGDIIFAGDMHFLPNGNHTWCRKCIRGIISSQIINQGTTPQHDMTYQYISSTFLSPTFLSSSLLITTINYSSHHLSLFTTTTTATTTMTATIMIIMTPITNIPAHISVFCDIEWYLLECILLGNNIYK